MTLKQLARKFKRQSAYASLSPAMKAAIEHTIATGEMPVTALTRGST